ncbi:MAG: cupredoxin domain-containing protein [Candidatus Heimdallarchaeota archaeon]
MLLMKTKKLLWVIALLSFIILGESLSINAIPTTINQEKPTPALFNIGTVYINITVSKTAFEPAVFTVKESATVNLTVESIDVGHTFEIPEYAIAETVPANGTVNVVFEATKLGNFTYSSVNSTATGTMIVEEAYVAGLPRPEDVTIIFDFKHNSNSEAIKDKYSTAFNWTRDNGFQAFINLGQELSEPTLQGNDILIIFEPNVNFTDVELHDIAQFIEDGGSLIIGGSVATAETNTYKLTEPFGVGFSNATAKYINSTNPDPIGVNNTLAEFTISSFTFEHPILIEDQYVPLTNELVSHIRYTGTILEYNASEALPELGKENLTETGNLVDTYTFLTGNNSIFADVDGDFTVDENETIGTNNTLIVFAETASNARICMIGSADLFNNSMIGRYPVNDAFFQRTLQWIAKMYAVIQNEQFAVSSYSLKRGEPLLTSVFFFTQNRTTTTNISATIRVWRLALVERSFELTAVNNSYYNCSIDTQNIRRGTFEFEAIAHKRGLGYNITVRYTVEIYPSEPEPLPVPVIYIITFGLSAVIGIVAIAFFSKSLFQKQKIGQEPEEGTEAKAKKAKQKEKAEEVDLEEYET